MLDLLYFLLIMTVIATMVAYSTWLLFHRLKNGEGKGKCFWEWVKNMLQAVW